MADVDQVLVEFRSRCDVAVREMGLDSSFGLREHRHSDGKRALGIHAYGESDDDANDSDAIVSDLGEERPSNAFMGTPAVALPNPCFLSSQRSTQHLI